MSVAGVRKSCLSTYPIDTKMSRETGLIYHALALNHPDLLIRAGEEIVLCSDTIDHVATMLHQSVMDKIALPEEDSILYHVITEVVLATDFVMIVLIMAWAFKLGFTSYPRDPARRDETLRAIYEAWALIH